MGGLKETDNGVYLKWSNSHSFFDVRLIRCFFFLVKILNILIHTYEERGESFNEIENPYMIESTLAQNVLFLFIFLIEVAIFS